jgi:hypothetical protein
MFGSGVAHPSGERARSGLIKLLNQYQKESKRFTK